MGTIASQITSLTIVYSNVYSDADQRKHQSSASLAFVRGSQRGPVNSPLKWPVTRKFFHLMTSSYTPIEFSVNIHFKHRNPICLITNSKTISIFNQNIQSHDILAQSSAINTIYYYSFILLSMHIFKCICYPKLIHKHTFYHNVNLNTKSLTPTPNFFLIESTPSSNHLS